MRWFPKPLERWKRGNDPLACPNPPCRFRKTSAETFAKGRYLLDEDDLKCDHCRAVSKVGSWRRQAKVNEMTTPRNVSKTNS
jgi:hypothetical protein